MKLDPFNETARQHRRHETRFAASIAVHADHADQYRLTFPDAQTDLAVVDVSKGGLGLRSGVFMPKNLRLILTVKGAAGGDGASGSKMTIRAVVRRCQMVDHKPTYLVGMQFIDAGGADERRHIASVTAPPRCVGAEAAAEALA
jgi:hypothetical protein